MNVRRTAYLETIRERLRANPIVSLVGPRQTGKTTLARMLAEESTEAVHFFDLESPADLARLANPELVLRPLTGLVILDEVQRRPDLFPVLRVLADRPGTPARFLILGSASPALIKAGSESLAGRVSFVDVTGFSLAELGADALPRLWWRGGFPRAWLAPDDAVARQWLDDFRRTFLERDIPQLGIQVPAATLGRFWTMVAHYHGQVLNLAELARALGSSEPTARRYLDILSGTYVVRQLSPWFENLKKRQVRSPKVYICDSGLLHALLGIPDLPGLQSHPKLGASWEGFCLEQMPSSICCYSMRAADSASSSSSRNSRAPRSPCASPSRTSRSTISTSSIPASMSFRWTNRSPPSRRRA
ncbi:MAG: ATP-binding protein [Burkholderiales bacterium]|nr:ATP-binding protein [Burkholderiales bacterium]